MSCLNWLVFIIMASALEHSHTPEGVRERLAQGASVSYLRDWIYGAIDGGVTTFAIVAGVVGANLPSAGVLLLGFANLVADGRKLIFACPSATMRSACPCFARDRSHPARGVITRRPSFSQVHPSSWPSPVALAEGSG